MMRNASIHTEFYTDIEKVKVERLDKKTFVLAFRQDNGSCGQHRYTDKYVLTREQAEKIMNKLSKQLEKK